MLISFKVEVAFEASLDRIRPGVVYTATISSPNGQIVETKATRELPLRKDPTQGDVWAIMLTDTSPEAVPIGAVVEIQCDGPPKQR